MDPTKYILDDYHIDGVFFVAKFRGYKDFDLFMNEILEFIHVHDEKLHKYIFPLMNEGKYEEALNDLISLDYDFHELIVHYVMVTGVYSILRRDDSDQLGLF